MSEATEVHHRVPRRLLAAYDRMVARERLDAEALQLWFECEGMLLDHGLDPDVSREELERAIEASAVEVTHEEHRSGIHGADWSRWGREGGLATLERYGHAWYRQLALRRWRKITAGELACARERLRRKREVGVRRPPTERRAALAARQLHYHRARLRWLQDRMRDNEALLVWYLTSLEVGVTVLPGGYQIMGGSAPTSQGVAVEKLAPECPYEQLELRVAEHEVAQETSLGEPRRQPTSGLGKPGQRTPGGATLTGEASAYAERECGRCFDGAIYVGEPTEVRIAPCPDCRGTGRVLAFLYPRPKGRRGSWPPEGRRDGDAP